VRRNELVRKEGRGVNERWLMIPCRTAHRLISEGMDRPLGLGDRARLRLHLTLCAMCSRVEHQMGFLRRAMRHIDES
jgi:hypothetical protein